MAAGNALKWEKLWPGRENEKGLLRLDTGHIKRACLNGLKGSVFTLMAYVSL